jgi:hypothetical protein
MKNPLKDLFPPQVRQALYALLSLVLLVWSIWEANNGDWQTAVPAIIAALIPLLAAGNVDTGGGPPPPGDLSGVPYAQLIAEITERDGSLTANIPPIPIQPDAV